jgi:hypothetical protein
MISWTLEDLDGVVLIPRTGESQVLAALGRESVLSL